MSYENMRRFAMTKANMIANEIRNKILYSKELKANQMLETEQEFCKKYNVSKMTIKNALDMLVLEGLIYKKRGVGTFVKNLSGKPLNNIIAANKDQNLIGFSQMHKGENINTRTVLYTIIPATEFLAEKLNILPGDFIYHLIRVRGIDASPIVHEETYMPIDIFPKLKKHHLEKSLYSYIKRTIAPKKIQSSHVCIQAKKCPESLALYLDLQTDEPIMQVTQTAFLNDGRIFEYSIASNRYDRFEFYNVIVRKEL